MPNPSRNKTSRKFPKKSTSNTTLVVNCTKKDGEIECGSSTIIEVCDVCSLAHNTEQCPLISSGVRIVDTALPTKAFLTLPNGLECKQLPDGTYNVISTKCLSKGTQFGPLDAPKTSTFNIECSYMLKIFKGTKTVCYLDTTDQDRCNWMILVKFAQNPQIIHNCICYQLKNEIYFSAVKQIPVGDSLVVAYSPGYYNQLRNCEDTPLETNTSATKQKLIHSLKTFESQQNTHPYLDLKSPETVTVKVEQNYEEEAALSALSLDQDFVDHDYIVPVPSSEDLNLKKEVPEPSSPVLDSQIRKSSRKKNVPAKFKSDFGDEIEKTNKKESDESSETDEDFGNNSGTEVVTDELSKRVKGRRLYAVLAKDSWKCRFCRETFTTDLESFALHLIEHYKKVGAARTEKDRMGKSGCLKVLDEVPKSLDPKVMLVRLSDEESKLKNIVAESLRPNKIKTEEESSCEDVETGDDVEEDDSKITTEPTYPYTCDICINQKVFNRAEYIIRHLKSHTNKLYCSDCVQKFPTKEELETHECVRNKEGKKQFECAYCGEAFSTNFKMKQHLFVHEKSLRCIKCRRFFKSGEELKNHVCVHKRKTSCEEEKIEVLMKCQICEETFVKSLDFEKHLKIHNSSDFSCPVCSKVLSNESLKMHTAICKMLQKFLDRECEELICPSYNCTKSYKDLQDFKDHMASHTHAYMCPSCYVRFRTALDINSHVCEKLSCDGCDMTFIKLIELRAHIMEEHGGPKSYCFECAFPFVSAEGYVKHGDCELKRALSKLPEKPAKPSKFQNDGNFICEICGATYTKWTSMKTHKSTHGPKKYRCSVCGKSFHRRELLIDHMYVHEEAQFECENCKKKFKSKKSLEVHMRIHTGKKPYQCSVCSKRFTQRVNMKSHEMTHLPEDEKCSVCPFEDCQKKFASREYLKFHIEGHEKGKNYPCDVCDKRFLRTHMLNQHKRTAHANHRYRCEFCIPNLLVRQKNSLFRHLTKRHSNLEHIWKQEDYAKKMFVPGDGNLTHPSAKHRLPVNSLSTESRAKEGSQINLNEDLNSYIISDSVMEDMEIETEEVILNTDEYNIHEDQPDQTTRIVLLQVDNTGNYVITYPDALQKTETYQEVITEEIIPFE